MKKGRFSKHEISYIKLHHETIPVSEIAKNLDREYLSLIFLKAELKPHSSIYCSISSTQFTED